MSRCGGCDRNWTGIAEAHCAACHRHFTTTTAFDKHRQGTDDNRYCADPATLLTSAGKPRLSAVLRASGEVWGYPSDGEASFGWLSTLPEAGIVPTEPV